MSVLNLEVCKKVVVRIAITIFDVLPCIFALSSSWVMWSVSFMAPPAASANAGKTLCGSIPAFFAEWYIYKDRIYKVNKKLLKAVLCVIICSQ